MDRATSDSSRYMKADVDGLKKNAGNYVDDILNAGIEKLQKAIELMLSKF